MGDDGQRARRWRLLLGVDSDEVQLCERDRRLDRALTALYGKESSRRAVGGLGASAPNVARWLGDIREFFPTPVVQVVQRDAFERLGLKRMLMEPEFLAAMEADIHLVADLMSLAGTIPEKTKETARQVVQQVVDDLMARLEQKTVETLRGALDRSRRTRRPRFADIDWPRTIGANLRHYQPEYRTIVPQTLLGAMRRSRSQVQLDDVILCVDQSGSMATSVVYSAIFAAVMASLPGILTKLVCFDTSIVDLTEKLQDPVDVLFGVQLGGGTDINQAIAYCEGLVSKPSKTHLVLITDLYEGGNGEALVQRVEHLIQMGVNVITLLALSDEGHPAFNGDLAAAFAAIGSPVFACTPDQFPELMAAALQGNDVAQWAASEGIGVVRGT